MRLAVVRALNRLNVDRLDIASLVWYAQRRFAAQRWGARPYELRPLLGLFVRAQVEPADAGRGRGGQAPADAAGGGPRPAHRRDRHAGDRPRGDPRRRRARHHGAGAVLAPGSPAADQARRAVPGAQRQAGRVRRARGRLHLGRVAAPARADGASGAGPSTPVECARSDRAPATRLRGHLAATRRPSSRSARSFAASTSSTPLAAGRSSRLKKGPHRVTRRGRGLRNAHWYRHCTRGRDRCACRSCSRACARLPTATAFRWRLSPFGGRCSSPRWPRWCSAAATLRTSRPSCWRTASACPATT